MYKLKSLIFLYLTLLSAGLTGCASNQPKETETTSTKTAATREAEGNAFDEAVKQHATAYLESCAVCHGENLAGAAQGPSLLGELKYGSSQAEIEQSIANGFIAQGMPAWSNTLSPDEISKLALYIGETRQGLSYTSFHYDAEFNLPTNLIASDKLSFRLETVINGLDPQPYAIALLPDGRLLLTEKKYGLRIVSQDGTKSEYIKGTPKASSETFFATSQKQELGFGWILDVALHPEYEENQWVYLSFTDRCENCNEFSKTHGRPVSMVKVVRGRIQAGNWVDEQTIWAANLDDYGSLPDLAAGGRLAFDNQGHLFFSVGAKGHDMVTGVQDFARSWGKIHRVFDNGEIPQDNPYFAKQGAIKSIWSYGHRSPQGLVFNNATQQLWGTEMGPRGGDELNLILPGENYGWPLHSKGLNYDGTKVAYGEQLNIDFDLKDIQQPIVDFTPAPAISSFTFYTGDAFKAWQGDILVGSLKGRSLMRIGLDGNKPTRPETLIDSVARVRDIEVGKKGEVYILFESNSGSIIARMVPAASGASNEAN